MLARRFSRRRLEKVYAIFERWGFGAVAVAVAVPALLPPPAPMFPFLLAAGAMQYSTQKFMAALTLGRIVRFVLLAFLAARYCRGMLGFILRHGHPVLVMVIGLIAAAIAALFVRFAGKRQGNGQV